MAEKIIHYVPDDCNGQVYVEPICGATFIRERTSPFFTNRPECKVVLHKRLKPVTDRVDYE